MAVTSIWPITGNPNGVIEYAINPAKTSEASRKETAALHAIDNVVEYASDDLKTEKRVYVRMVIECSSDVVDESEPDVSPINK